MSSDTSSTVGSTTAPSREITAAVVREQGSFEIGQAQLEAPRADEILVRIVAAGLCHTDLVVRDQLYPVPLPIVLGHEGAGVVEAVGAAVHKVAVGDHVALSFLNCGACRPCFDGSPASHFRLLEGGRVDPESAVGALLAFGDEHPADFPPRGTFFVKQSGGGGEGAAGNGIFGTADLASFKLSTLLSWGFEIGVMPLADEALQAPTVEERRQAFALAQNQLAPLLPGYAPAAIALPDGLPQETRDLLASGTDTEPGPRFTAAVEPGGGVAPSPFLPGFAPYRIPRLPAGDAAGNSWREAIEQSEIFISAGE